MTILGRRICKVIEEYLQVGSFTLLERIEILVRIIEKYKVDTEAVGRNERPTGKVSKDTGLPNR